VLVRWIAVGGIALAYGSLLVLLRGEPSVASDQGVFLSVAARILDGDHLYSEVVDNKDPLFFYTYAAALAAGGWRGPFLLDGLWLGVAALSMALLVRELRAPRAAVLASFVVYPLALTAGWYLVGMSMLAGLALAPLAPWFWLRRRFAAAGLVLAVVMLFKLNLALLVAAPLLVLVLFVQPSRIGWREARLAALGWSGGVLGAAVLLGVRGELSAYLDTIAYNFHYASALGESNGLVGRAADHLRVARDFFGNAGRWQLPLAILVLAVFAAAAVLAARRGSTPQRALAGVAAATLLGSIATIGLTAYWEHHLQLLAYPAVCIAATLIAVADHELGRRAGVVAAATFMLFALWTSVKNDGGLEVSSAWTSTPISAGAIALERARLRVDPNVGKITYAVLGSNSENGHAAFIGDEFDLACRWFQLYPFNRQEQFDETLRCAEREAPRYVLVTLGFFETEADGSSWAEFVSRSKRLLQERYELVEEEPPGFQVWMRA
jgi:hypothetical protein